MKVENLVVGPFQSNCFVVACEATNDAIIVDAGDEGARIVATVRELGVNIRAVVTTHAHLDHVAGLGPVASAYDVPRLIHRDAMATYGMMEAQAEMFGLPAPQRVEFTRFVAHGDTVEFGEVVAEFVESPGHSPGSVCLLFRGPDPQIIFAGDVLFQGSIGRTDLPGGNFNTLMTTLRDQFLPLADDTIVYPGHGPATTIGVEKRTNPFLMPLV